MGNFHSISSVQNIREGVMFKVEKYSSQDSKPVSQNSKPVSQNSKPVSRTSQLEGSGLENSKPMSQTAQLEDPWLECSKPWSPVYLGPSEDHFQRLEGDDGQSFEVDNQQDKK
ncbi:hypothetical protein Ancab_023699, partial [Ancistrocladus abbreviatus]